MMITGTGIEMGEQVGCWATCHADNTYMPFEPDADAIAASGDVAAALMAETTITKYLSESRTKIEVKGGRRGKAQGGAGTSWPRPLRSSSTWPTAPTWT